MKDPLDPTNEERAQWAQIALNAFMKATRCDECDAISDLIANLAHLCDRRRGEDGFDLAECMSHAANVYADEAREEGVTPSQFAFLDAPEVPTSSIWIAHADTDSGSDFRTFATEREMLAFFHDIMVKTIDDDEECERIRELAIGSPEWGEAWDQFREDASTGCDYYSWTEVKVAAQPPEPPTVPNADAIRELAKERLERVLEFDANAVVSLGDDNGAYVQAWAWVDFAGTDLDKNQQD